MIELPVCRWRREPTIEGRHGCVSPRLIVGAHGVPDAGCATCRVRDHAPPAPPPGLCRHLGPRLSVRTCPPCSEQSGRKIEIAVHQCQLHGECTLRVPVAGARVCQSCPDHAAGASAPAIGDVRHLMYFVCPLGRVWRWNVQQLRQRISLFNGARHVVCVQGPGLAPVEAVQAELPDAGVTWHVRPNDPELKEYVGFPLLLRELSQYEGIADVSFYGHAKGVSSEAWGPAVRRWTESMYSGLLDYWPAVRRELGTHPCCGLWRKRQGWYPASPSMWHYAGSFRWVRNRDMYARRWDEYLIDWCCPEDHVGRLFRLPESSCLYGDMGSAATQLYGPEAWDLWAQAERDRFERDHQADRMVWPADAIADGEAHK